MSDVKRYDTDNDGDEYERDDGPFVHYEDYESVEADRDAVLDDRDNLVLKLQELEAENLRLQQELKDALEEIRKLTLEIGKHGSGTKIL